MLNTKERIFCNRSRYRPWESCNFTNCQIV